MKSCLVIIFVPFAISLLCNASVSLLKDGQTHMHPPPVKAEIKSRMKREDSGFHRIAFESTSQYWRNEAQKKLRLQLDKKENKNVAKNVVMFLGDGMSTSTVTAARIYFGQKMGDGQPGEESSLSFEEFPHIGLSKVSQNLFSTHLTTSNKMLTDLLR